MFNERSLFKMIFGRSSRIPFEHKFEWMTTLYKMSLIACWDFWYLGRCMCVYITKFVNGKSNQTSLRPQEIFSGANGQFNAFLRAYKFPKGAVYAYKDTIKIHMIHIYLYVNTYEPILRIRLVSKGCPECIRLTDTLF